LTKRECGKLTAEFDGFLSEAHLQELLFCPTNQCWQDGELIGRIIIPRFTVPGFSLMGA
jgi:hypothetical protein